MAADDNGVEKFALGMIVAVILFLFLRREFGRHGATANGSIFSASGGGSHAGNTRGGCGCSDTSDDNEQVIPIGGQTYNNTGSYGNTSVYASPGKVVAATQPAGPSRQWYAGPAPGSNNTLLQGGSGSVWLS